MWKAIDEYFASYPNVDYWNDKKATIFLSYTEKEKKYLYFVNAVGGKDKAACIKLNEVIARNHLSLKQEDPSGEEPLNEDPLNIVHPAMPNNKLLLPIELLLKRGSLTLFEHNAKFLLETEIGKTTTLEDGCDTEHGLF